MDGRTYGAGDDVVVVIHGGPGAPGYMAPVARMLADRWRVLEPFQRRGGGAAPLTVATHVEDLRALLDRPVRLVGSSWGAMLALTFAARHPELVRRLVLVGCGTFDEGARAEYRRLQDERIGAETLAHVAELRAEAERATDPARREELLAQAIRPSADAQHFDRLTEGDEIAEIDMAGHAETWSDAMRLQADGTQPAEFAAITAPALLIHGDHDPHPGRAIAASLRPYMPQLRYVELARCGHMPWLERHARDAFMGVVRAELGRVSRPSEPT